MPKSVMDIRERKNLAVKVSKETGKLLLAGFGRRFKVSNKGDRDLVTEIDKKAERKIITALKKAFPADGIISEESSRTSSESGFSWIIDPIDGTHNFVHQLEIFGTSIALTFQDKVAAGIIYMPGNDELYLAEKGKGAFCNGRKISVSRRGLRESTLVYDSTIRLNKGPMLFCLGDLADAVFNIRMFGSTVRSLSYIAEGKTEIEVEFNDKVWDFAAGLLLVEEAGGKCTDLEGRPWSLQSKGYIASNGIVHSAVLEAVKRGMEKGRAR